MLRVPASMLPHEQCLAWTEALSWRGSERKRVFRRIRTSLLSDLDFREPPHGQTAHQGIEETGEETFSSVLPLRREF